MKLLEKYLMPLAAISAVAGPVVGSEDTATLFAERSRTVVYMEYYVQHEIDRQAVQGVGLVVSDGGIICALDNAFPEWVPSDRFRDIRLFPAGNPLGDGLLASYLGQDPVTGWHFLQLDDVEKGMPLLRPITDFEAGVPDITDELWGVCMTAKELDYITYFRDGKLSASQNLPLPTGFATHEIAVPGGPIFLADGRFAGRADPSMPRERDMWIGNDYYRANIRHPDESYVFQLAKPFLADLKRALETRSYEQRRGWIGVVGTEPLDRDTARFLGLEGQGAIVISEVIPDSPAQTAGLEARDIVVAINGERLPRLRPDSVIQLFFERQITLAGPGGSLPFTVLRGEDEIEITLAPGEVPKRMREAERTYFDGIGLGLRELIMSDSIQRRRDHREAKGAAISFIKNNSAAASANLRVSDWVLEIAGVEIADFKQAVQVLESSIADSATEEIVFMVLRNNDTSVVRLRKP